MPLHRSRKSPGRQTHGEPPGQTRPPASSEHEALQRKLADLVRQQRYTQAIRLREQTLRRQPDLDLHPSEAHLWRLEGQLAAAEGQIKRAEAALAKAMALGLHGEPEYELARLRLRHSGVKHALEPLHQAYNANTLPVEYAGAYLKLLLLQGEVEQVQQLVRTAPERFQPQQIQWVDGVLSLQANDPAAASRAFQLMVGPASPRDQVGAWRAWAQLEAGHPDAAAAALVTADPKLPKQHRSAQPKGPVLPVGVAVALDLAARDGRRPGELVNLSQPTLPHRELALALELLFHLRQGNLLTAANLLLEQERSLLSAHPALAVLRRPLLLLAGQQALEQDSDEDAIRCWRPLVERNGFDPDLALRLYPLLDRCESTDNNREAERLATLLISWVRRSARDAPNDWPQPLLNRTLARLHCWQADQFMVLGAQQQARRSVKQAEDLAGDDPEVVGRRGILAGINGDWDAALPLIWQSLDGGCRYVPLYSMLRSWLEMTQQHEELTRLRRTHGPAFDDGLQASEGAGQPPSWLELLGECKPQELADRLERAPQPDAGVRALRLLLEHTSPAKGLGAAKLNLDVLSLAAPWEDLLATLPAGDRAEAITAALLATHCHCLRRRKAVLSQIEAWHAELEQLATASGSDHSGAAQRAQLMLLSLRLRPGEAFQREARRLLGRTARPERTLALALLDLRQVASTRPWRPIVEELQRQDPQNALLPVALATMEPQLSRLHHQLMERGFGLARQQQDQEALAACHREEQWSNLSFDRKLARQGRSEFKSSFAEFIQMTESIADLLEELGHADLHPDEPGPGGRHSQRQGRGGGRKTFRDL